MAPESGVVLYEGARRERIASGPSRPVCFRRLAGGPEVGGPLCRAPRRRGYEVRRQASERNQVRTRGGEGRLTARPERPAWSTWRARANRRAGPSWCTGTRRVGRSRRPGWTAGARRHSRRLSRVRPRERVRGSRQRADALRDPVGCTRLTGRNDPERRLPLLLFTRPGAVQDLGRGYGDLRPVGYDGGPPEAVDPQAGRRSDHLLRVRGRRQQPGGTRHHSTGPDVGGRRNRDGYASQHGDRGVARLWQYHTAPAIYPSSDGDLGACSFERHRQRVLRRRGDVRIQPGFRAAPG